MRKYFERQQQKKKRKFHAFKRKLSFKSNKCNLKVKSPLKTLLLNFENIFYLLLYLMLHSLRFLHTEENVNKYEVELKGTLCHLVETKQNYLINSYKNSSSKDEQSYR